MKKPGKTKEGLVYDYDKKPDFIDFAVYDFDVDDDKLKSRHTEKLDEAIKFLEDNYERRDRDAKSESDLTAWMITLDGFCSRTGSSAHNKILGKQRETAVNQYFVNNIKRMPLSNVTFKPGEAHGWEDTTVQGEHEEGRCVRVTVHRPGIRPPVVGLPPGESKKFKIRMLWDITYSGPKGVTPEATKFEIYDIRRQKAAKYTYIGVGLGVPTPKIKVPTKLIRKFPWTKKMPQIVPGDSVITLVGEFSDFKTNKPARFRDFEGEANFAQGPAVGPLSLFNWFSFHNQSFLRKEMAHDPHPIKIQTGFTFGINIFDTTVGNMSWDGTESTLILP